MPFIDNSHRRKQHSGADVEPGFDQEIDVCLFQFEFSLLLASFHDGVLDFKLTPEFDAARKAVTKQKDEAMEIKLARFVPILVEVKIHVTGDWQACFAFVRLPVVARDRYSLQRTARGRFRRGRGDSGG